MIRGWTLRWQSYKEGRQTKIWFPKPKLTFSEILIGKNRRELGLFVQMLTGHCRLNRHESLINPSVDPTCRLCLEEEETAWHVIGECPALWIKRRDSFDTLFLDNPPKHWKVKQLQKFLRSADLEKLNDRVALEEDSQRS